MGGLQGLEAAVTAGFSCGSQCGYLDAPACAGAGGHEESSSAIGGGDGNALGLVGGTASCCFLGAGGVLVEGFREVFL